MKALWLVLALAFLCTPVVAQIVPMVVPEPQDYGPCDLPEPVLFASLDGATLSFENLIFLNGTMYVTAFREGLYAFDPNGTHRHILKDVRDPGPSPIEGPASMMGLATIDGALYVSQGSSVVTPVEARVLRFEEPGSANYTVYADGFDGANGLAADLDGNLYLAHGFREGIYKILPDGSWDLWMTKAAANGVSLHPDEDRLTVAYVGSAGSRVVTVPLDDPTAEETLFIFNAVDPEGGADNDPSKPLVSKLIDDLVVGPDGMVYATAHERLQTLRGDPVTGHACLVIAAHEDAPTSARIAHGFGAWDGWLFVTDNAADIYAVDIRGGSGDGTMANSTDEASDEAGERASTPVPVWTVLGSTIGLAAYARRRGPRRA